MAETAGSRRRLPVHPSMSLVFLVIQSVNRLVDLYQFLLILYILSGWIPQLRQSTVGHILAQLSEPYLRLFRGIFPLWAALTSLPSWRLLCCAWFKES